MVRFARLLTTTTATAFASSSSTSNHAYIAGSNVYALPPVNLALKTVVIISRHGDRSQIARNISAKYPEKDDLHAFWKSKLPSKQQLSELSKVAVIRSSSDKKIDSSLEDLMYEGEDFSRKPFGMLTHEGVKQLIATGNELRKRYVGTFISDEDLKYIQCRSTHMCRTVLSLRSLLVGLFGGSAPNGGPVVINVRPKKEETMYPQASGPCPAMGERRSIVIGENFLLRTISGYEEFERRMKDILDVNEVNWITTKEILSCHDTHGYPLPLGVTQKDIDKVGLIAAHMWGFLYKDDTLNRLGIGRFLSEILNDLEGSMEVVARNNQELAPFGGDECDPPKMLIYSGHDSTLVPFLCALGIYDDKWPPYASYLTLEVAEEDAGRWVRVLYNDVPALFPGDAALTRDGLGTWWPYSHLRQRHEALSMTEDEYRQACSDRVNESSSAAQAQKEMQEEVSATISGN